MQVQENNGVYREPEPFDKARLEYLLKSPNVRRVVVFPVYGEDGKPTPELRRAWRRAKRTKH